MKNIVFIVFAGIALFLGAGCGKDAGQGGDEGHGGHGAHGGHGDHEESTSVTLTATQLKSIPIAFGHIERKQLTASLKATGILKVPNQNKATISPIYGGIIRNLYVQPGGLISRGQAVATIANPEFLRMQEEFLTLVSKIKLAGLEYERQKMLNEGNAGALKNLQQSEAELAILKTRHASLQKQLEGIGIRTGALTTENLATLITVQSPISGTVSSVGVNIGSHVTETTSIAEIVDNSQLHLDLYVYERDLSKLRVGQTIHFTLTNNPGKEYDADIYGISNTFEDATKAIAVHALVKGSKEGLISGMSVTALVSLDSATVPAVPSEAIVNHEGQDYIFVVVEGEDPAGSGHAHDDGHAHNEGHDHGDHAHAEEHGHGEAHDHAEAHAHGEEHSHEHEEHEHGGHESAAGSMQFQRIPVAKGTSDVGYSEITLLAEIPPHARVVTKGAFFLLAKMTNQGEAHSH